MSVKRRRRKGIAFEGEVAKAFVDAGYYVRGLEAGGDQLCITRDGTPYLVECKRQERNRWGEWLPKVLRDAEGGRWLLVWKQNWQPALVTMPLKQYLQERRKDGI